MPEDLRQSGLGCNLTAPPADLQSIEILLGAGELPEQYIVPAWRDCFRKQVGTDINGVTKEYLEPIPEKIRPRILDQGALDSCVGHATSVQKSAQEGVLISPREIFRLAKRLDGYSLEAFGTSLWAAQDALIRPGAAEDSMVDRNPLMGRAKYLSLDDVTPAVEGNRAAHRSKRAYTVPRNLLKETFFQTGFPIVLSSPWYAQDNAIGADGIMRLPQTTDWLGHAYASIGWLNLLVAGVWRQAYPIVNSFGSNWGANGMFYVPIDGTQNRLGNGYVAIDIDTTLADVLARYTGKNVRSGIDHWKIEAGTRRKYQNELVWWAHGNLFGYEVLDIAPNELELIPLGAEMKIEDAPWEKRELIRQIRASLGAS